MAIAARPRCWRPVPRASRSAPPRRCSSSRDEASDVSQDVAVDVLRSLAKLRDPEAFDAWVHRITVRHALRRVKRRRGRHAAETPLALLPEAAEPVAPGEIDRDAVLAARQALADAFASLPPKQRLALALRYVHDLPDAEIAAALGCRVGTVHALLSRGRGTLRHDPQLAELALALEGTEMSGTNDHDLLRAAFAPARTLEPSPGRGRPRHGPSPSAQAFPAISRVRPARAIRGDRAGGTAGALRRRLRRSRHPRRDRGRR